MKKIAVVPNTEKDINLKATYELVKILNSFNKEIIIDKALNFSDKTMVTEVEKSEIAAADLMIVLGGGGSILEIAEDAAKNGTPVLGINFGNLGFLTQAEEISREIFEEIFKGEYAVRESMMLHASVYEGDVKVGDFTALNDMVIKGDIARMVNIKLDIDGTNTNNYPADGVIIATATGSTAYSLSAGGAIVHPELNAIMITPICPHTLKARCMLIPDTKKVKVAFAKPHRNNAILNVDGKKSYTFGENGYVEIEKSQYKVKFINLNKRNFYDIVREKIADRSI